MKLTELDCQLAVWYYRNSISAFPLLFINIFFFNWWESDVLYISKSNYVTEFEIKCSLADFRADSKKHYKHHQLQSGSGFKPAYFYYVCPADLIPIKLVPDYAGLAYVINLDNKYVTDKHTLKIIKPAPRLDADPIDIKKFKLLSSKATSKFWNLLRRTINANS